MTNLKANVQFTCTEPGLSAEEKLQAIQSLYTEEEYDEAVYGKWISIFDTWMGIEDAEERNNTSLDPLYLEEWIDVELLCQVRMLHQGIKEPTQQELENFDKLNDVMTIDNNPRDKKKFFVMNNPGYRTIYHHIPWWWMTFNIVKSNSPYKRKIIWNEEWNFEEIIDNDKPDWITEADIKQEKEQKDIKLKRKLKLARDRMETCRINYKLYYDAYDNTHDILCKKEWDKYYKEYKRISEALDKVKRIDNGTDISRLTWEANTLLHMFTEMQQKCPDKYVDSVTREDIKSKYKKQWFERTRYYLARLIKRLDDMIARKKYDEEHWEEEETA